MKFTSVRIHTKSGFQVYYVDKRTAKIVRQLLRHNARLRRFASSSTGISSLRLVRASPDREQQFCSPDVGHVKAPEDTHDDLNRYVLGQSRSFYFGEWDLRDTHDEPGSE